ncbi:MAG: restriction endonuclease subunit S [Burkholderiaceae bacterium]|nr:restriction endonuclease subunit S [Burkholderiaceae bacterium]
MSSEWATFQFKELCDITRGASPRPIHDFLGDEGMPWIKIADATAEQSRFISGTKKKIKPHGVRASVEVFPGDLILSNSATPGLPKFLKINACIHDGWMLLRNFKKLDKSFAYWLLLAERVKLVAQGNGSVFTNLKTDILKNHEVTIPPLGLQVQIAGILNELDDRITILRETNATLEAIAQALFKSWFVDFDPVRAKIGGRAPEGMDEATARLFPDSFEESELGLVPRGWRAKPIGEVCTLGRGSSPRPIQNFMGHDIPWIKIADATASDGMFVFKTKEKIKREGASKSTAVGHGDLIMSNSASCGIPVFVEVEGCIHDGWLYFKNFNGVSKILMFHWLRHISDHLVHIADGSVQKNLNIGLVSSQLIICPGNPVLSSFDALSQPLLERMRENCQQAQTLATLRNTLLPRLISGQLRLPETQAAVEEALA